MKRFLKKYPALALVLGIAILLVLQQKMIMPLVYEVIKSDLFLVDSNDKASQMPISTPLTELAFIHCNHYIKSELGTDSTITFADKPINVWSFGNYQYIVNSEITTTSNEINNVPSAPKKYVCRITYKGGDDQEGIEDFTNWSIDGLSGLKQSD